MTDQAASSAASIPYEGTDCTAEEAVAAVKAVRAFAAAPVPCEWCKARVAAEDMAYHAMWHYFYDLHGLSCQYARTREAQRHTDVYLVPQNCSCGLAAVNGA